MARIRIHLDTDIGSDTDDLCALAFLLGRPDVEITGITTVADFDGIRAGMVEHVLSITGRSGIAVAAGADGSLGGFRVPPAIADLEQHWGVAIEPAPSAAGAALDLMAASIESGATVVAVGPYTNLALLAASRPGLLDQAPIYVMGGCATRPKPGYPQWEPFMDYNVQQDATAARLVFERLAPVVVQMPATLEAPLAESALPKLRACGRLGELIADQAVLHADEFFFRDLGRSCEKLPDDLLNFQYDPVTCAAAIGWDGVEFEEMRVVVDESDGVVSLRVDEAGLPTRIATSVDGDAFNEIWIEAVARASG